MREIGAALGICLVGGCLAPASGQNNGPLKPIRVYDPPAVSFATHKKPPANDLSGIACMPAQGEKRTCVVINDEEGFAQFAQHGPGGLVPGAIIPLLAKGVRGPLGSIPTGTSCSQGEGDFKELDGEAVAYSAPFFYVIGSHGCSRKKGKFHASAFVTARFRVDASGAIVNPNTGEALKPGDDPVQSTYRVADALKLSEHVSDFYGKDLTDDNGLNIEGLAVVNSKLFAGLRGPAKNQQGFLIAIDIDDLFKAGPDPLKTPPLVASVQLKKDVGIRDLAVIDDGRFLVLAGPAQEQNVPYSLFIVDPTVKSGTGFKSELLADLETVSGGKAEGLQILDRMGKKLRFLVLFDSLSNGGASEYEVTLK